MPLLVDSLIVNGHILTVDGGDRVIDDGAIAVRDGAIVCVGTTADVGAKCNARDRIDCGGGIVHPGFIDAHIHVSQYAARSALPRMAGGAINMGHWKAELTPQDEHASAMLAAIDYLSCGYTGFVDPGTIFAPDAVADVARDTGIRVWLTDPYVADLAGRLAERVPELASPAFLARWPRDTDEAMARVGSQLFRNRDPSSRVRAFVGLYGEATASPALLAHASGVAKEAGVRMHMHAGYQPKAYLAEETALGCTLTEHLDRHGWLASHATLVHMNLVRDAEIRQFADAGMRVVWCPWGQLQAIGGGGAQPRMVQLIRAGVPVGLATDIPRVCNFDGLGMLAMAGAAASGTPVGDDEVLRARTLSAAACVGAERELGSIEIGKRADIVIRHPVSSEDLRISAAYETAILAERTSVATVLVDGVVVFEAGRPTKVEAADIRHEARMSAARIAARIGL
jgi:cytosine/adenosine deaminase-related metal-dependent hydrolase